MAENYTKIIEISLKSDDLIKNLAEIRIQQEAIKKSQAELNEQYKQGKISQDDYATATAKNTETTKALNAQARQYSSEIQNNIKNNKNAADSIDAMRANVANLTAAYNKLSKEEREGDVGKQMATNIKTQNDEIRKANEGIGNFRDNVGNYKNSILEAVGANNSIAGSFLKIGTSGEAMKGAFSVIGSGIAGLSKALLTLIANPIGLVLAAIAVSIMAVSSAIKSSDELGDRWAVTTSKLSRVWDAFKKVLQVIAGIVMNIVDAYATMVGKVLKLAEKLPFGIGEAVKKMNDQFDMAEKMAKKANELEDAQRAFRVAQAKRELEISELRAKAVDKETYGAEQRLTFLNKAIAIERVNMTEKLRLARLDLEIAREKASRNSASEEALDQLADKEAALYRIQAESADFERSVSKQRNGAINEIKEENKQNAEKIQKIQELKGKLDELAEKYFDLSKIPMPENLKIDDKELFPEDETWEEQKKRISDHLKQLEESYRLQILMAGDSEKAQSEAAIKANDERIAYINSLDDVQKVQQFGSIDAAKIAVLEAEKAKSDAIKKTGDTAKKATEDQIKAVADMFGAMSQFLEEFAGQNEALGMLAKGLALFEIGLNTAKAVSGAIASAQSVPFPGNIAAIAVGVTSVLSAMVQAKQIFSSQQKPENNVKKVKKPKFHTGGLVTGGTEVDATLLTGESVMTRSATSMFGGALSAMEYAASGNGVSLQNYQGGQGLEFFKQAFAAALKEMPTPIVSVKEIERVQNRIRISEEIAKR